MDNISTRLEDDSKSKTSLLNADTNKLEKHLSNRDQFIVFKVPANEEEEEELLFSVEVCWDTLFKLPSCVTVFITEKVQKNLQLKVGENVSQEFPWKQVPFKLLKEFLFDEVENSEILYSRFQPYQPNNQILIGYAPLLTQDEVEPPEGDPFILFYTTEDIRFAMAIIKNLEMYERWRFNKRIWKTPRKWYSWKSEREVDILVDKDDVPEVKVEIQSVYPLAIPKNKDFDFRNTSDARDGYVELLPEDSVKYDIIVRRRIHVGVQVAPRHTTAEQQTDPTFPSNAWAQYLYEIKEEDEGLAESSEEEQPKPGEEAHEGNKEAVVAKPKGPPELSDQIKFLLKTLKFNQVDMYRNDYLYISEKQVQHYTSPYLEESLCYANISKSGSRFVCGIDWYPKISGFIVTSYTFDTSATELNVSQDIDLIQRAVLQPNPILMWSFADNLNFKLEFESPQEVSVLSFSPTEPYYLLGGCRNGQIIIWDLMSRADNLGHEEILTSAQLNYREMIADFLKWTIQINEDFNVPPAYITAQESSQKSFITGIYWMGRHFFVNTFGKVCFDHDKNAHHKCFITTSYDGSLTFWNLNSFVAKKGSGGSSNKSQPKELTQSESPFKNKMLKPIYCVSFTEPITSIIADTSTFSCEVPQSSTKNKKLLNYPIEIVSSDPQNMRQSAIVSTMYGRLERVNWLGLYTDDSRCEHVTTGLSFARVHDGPITAMRKNPFYPMIFVSIGRTVFALWKEDYNYSPIFWRKRPCDLTAVAWSETRPSVLFLTRIDGCLEAWDILTRDDDACMSEILGGGIVTAISEHRPSEPEKLLGIGDYNSSFRMIKLPLSFYQRTPNELEHFEAYIAKEENRKKGIQEWEQKYDENHRDIIEAKRQAETDARREMERIEKEEMLAAARKVQEELEAFKRANAPQHMTYTERMKQKWDELNLNRLMTILMSRKRVDPEKLENETALEKKRLSYEAAKKASILHTLQHTADEVSAIRARILPHEKADMHDHDRIQYIVDEVLEYEVTYGRIEEEADAIIENFSSFGHIEYAEFLHRGESRRLNLNKTLGGNTERLWWYEDMEMENKLNECNWGYEEFAAACTDFATKNVVMDVRSIEPTIELSESIPYDEVNENPAPPVEANE